MSRHRNERNRVARNWANIALLPATVLCLVAFWKLAPGATFVIAVVALIAMIVSFWVAGKD